MRQGVGGVRLARAVDGASRTALGQGVLAGGGLVRGPPGQDGAGSRRSRRRRRALPPRAGRAGAAPGRRPGAAAASTTPRPASAGMVRAGIAHDQSTAACSAKAARMASGIPMSGSTRTSAARRTPQTTAPTSAASRSEPDDPEAREDARDDAVRLAGVDGVVGHVALLQVHQREAAGALPDDGARREATPRLPPPRAALVARRAHQPAGVVGDGVAALPAELGAAVARPSRGAAELPAEGAHRDAARRRRGRWRRPGARRARSRARRPGAPGGGRRIAAAATPSGEAPPQSERRPTRAGRWAPGRPTGAGR